MPDNYPDTDESFFKIGITKSSIGIRIRMRYIRESGGYIHQTAFEVPIKLQKAIYLETKPHQEHKRLELMYFPQNTFTGQEECYKHLDRHIYIQPVRVNEVLSIMISYLETS